MDEDRKFSKYNLRELVSKFRNSGKLNLSKKYLHVVREKKKYSNNNKNAIDFSLYIFIQWFPRRFYKNYFLVDNVSYCNILSIYFYKYWMHHFDRNIATIPIATIS